MLLRSGNPYGGPPLTLLGGAVGAFGHRMRNSGQFGVNAFIGALPQSGQVSVPAGRPVTDAIIPALKYTGVIAATGSQRTIGRAAGLGIIFGEARVAGAALGATSFPVARIAAGVRRVATSAGAASTSASIRATTRLSAHLQIGAQPTAFDIAQAIWNAPAAQYAIAGTMGRILNDLLASAGGLTPTQSGYLQDLARIHGLIAGTPLIVTPTTRVAGPVSQQITEASNVVTVSRV